MDKDFLSAGYYVARPSRGPLSASTCLCGFFPNSWAIRWTNDTPREREEAAAKFGLGPDALDRVTEWATGAFQEVFGWPNVFYSLEAAQRARAEFLPPALDVALFGLGLHREDAERFLPVAAECGVFECVKQRRARAPGGRQSGFDLLATCLGQLTCSWLCNGLETVCAEQLGVQQNDQGLIADYAGARRCAEYIARPDVGAEPGLWLPWLVTLYSE